MTRQGVWRTTMRPLGLYLVITDNQREHGWRAPERRTTFARVDATPITEPERVTRIGRLAGVVRRRVTRTARA